MKTLKTKGTTHLKQKWNAGAARATDPAGAHGAQAKAAAVKAAGAVAFGLGAVSAYAQNFARGLFQ